MAVSTAPGQTQFEVIRSPASAWAAERVRLTTPAFEAEYGVVRVVARRDTTRSTRSG